jgi:hypothetical protein
VGDIVMEVQQQTHERSFVFCGRLIVGLAQGLALYLLYSAFEDKTWPATNGTLFAPLATVALFVPLVFIQGLGTARLRTLVIWTLLAAAIVAFFAGYDIWHGWPETDTPRQMAEGTTLFLTAVFLFIAHALVIAGATDGKIVARYHTYFDVAWKQGLQLVLGGLFVGIFWLLLWLGAALFKLIDLDFLQVLIEHCWFAIPATTLAVAAALHLSDVRASLVRGARSLLLVLFSWLLPLIAVIGGGFLLALVFTGVQPLWETRMATRLLLTAAIALIVLINAAYQDGDAERTPARVLRWAANLGGVLLVPIVALAGYAVHLRVAQYGWSGDRIAVTAAVAIAAAYALGYAIAALWAKPWFKPLERWNVAAAVITLAVIAAFLSPLADPARISVASQIARLESGQVAPSEFDFYYLHREGGRFGKAALEKLVRSSDPALGGPAKRALAQAYPDYTRAPQAPTPSDLARRFKVHPEGAKLPASFLTQQWPAGVNTCLDSFIGDYRCDAILKDINGRPGIVVVFANPNSADYHQIDLLRFDGTGWHSVGRFSGNVCGAMAKSLREGRFDTVAPVQRDVVVGGHRFALTPLGEGDLPCN